ncbi:ATP-binding protein [Adlercreutzia aquisgranensis]|uniref:ATP-binding protein n=1 Tax=Adlercreutzia aquisgranensis TaxID=2941323 RepID=UPI00203B3D67|nr:ATP-binding protein [Adlercreutzia aquisgranensis]
MERRRLAKRFFLLALGVSVAVLVVYLAWSYHTKGVENERRALAEARVLSAEIGAAWEYIDSVQILMNRGNGEGNFAGVYCAVAAKSIAESFSDDSEYSIRYVREDPRNLDDVPDAFESRALERFEQGGVEECYGFERQDDRSVFRYVALLDIEEGCLSCHGDPAGEKDVTGYAKEGMAVGDVAGAVSIVMPMDAIFAEARDDMLGAIVFFCVLMGAVTVILVLGLRAWVTAPIIDENEKLRRESEDQSNFLTIITHELKTPLSSILAFTELWKERVPDDSAESRELVDEVETNGRVLLDMIDNVLDTAKLEAGTKALASGELDAFDLAAQVRATMGPLARKKGVALTLSVGSDTPLLLGDEEVIRRIVVNLVNNALRFTPAGGSVSVAMGCERGRFTIRVEDTGAGIPSDQLEHIFDRFVSAPHSETTSEGGTGLGLSIVSTFASLMGGQVSVESEVGRGSCFIVELPLPVLDDELEEEGRCEEVAAEQGAVGCEGHEGAADGGCSR